MIRLIWLSIALIISTFSFAEPQQVNVYSFRQPALINHLLEKFTEQSGVKVNVIFSKTGLLERIALEGKNSPVDVILGNSIFDLQRLKAQNSTQAVNEPDLIAAISEAYRDTENHWFALTLRSRIIYASVDEKRAPLGEVQSYEDLAKLKARVCMRPASHAYNLALVASMVNQHGLEQAEQWLAGLKNSLARKPQGNDRAQVQAIKNGECDYAIGNSYYYGHMAFNNKNPEQQEWVKAVRIIQPNQKDRGVHINISGMALAKFAPHQNNAVKLMKFLASSEAQASYAEVNYEFPVRSDAKVNEFMQESFGEFVKDTQNLKQLIDNLKQAQFLINKVSLDQ